VALEALRTAEERMRFALDTADVGIWDMDYTTGVLKWSETIEGHYGLLPKTFDGRFETFIELVHPDDRESLLATVANAMTHGSDFATQHRSVAPDGEVRWLTGAGRVLLGEQEEPVRGVGISQNVTARRTLERLFQQAQKMDAIGRLASGVAHDFNNLLTVILGFAGFVAEDVTLEKRHAADLDQVVKAAQRAAGLTRQLLAFSRQQVLQTAPVDVNILLTDMIAMLERLIGEHIEVRLDLTIRRASGRHRSRSAVRAEAVHRATILATRARGIGSLTPTAPFTSVTLGQKIARARQHEESDMTSRWSIRYAVMLSLVAAGPLLAQQHEHGSAANEKFGSVSFSTSCRAAAAPLFNRAVALLHSFEFGRAIEAFNAALKADPSCAMAEWGVALSSWGNPFAPGRRPAAALRQGLDAVNRAKTIGLKTAREQAYVDAVSQLYAGFETVDQPSRVLRYRDAMATVAASNPNDSEAAIFHALAIAVAAPPTDKTYADLVKAGAILEKIIASQPDHPGLAHYIIHSYDVPRLADQALEAARRYAKIAPSAPHALHMPSHTFTRVGYWQESIDTNIASAATAKRGGATAEELHAMDYQAYAYLQTAQDRAARGILDQLPEVKVRFDPEAVGSAAPGSAGVFALAAIPARYALERGAWADAAALVPDPSRYPYADALTYFARALGAARTGDAAGARAAIDALSTIKDRLAEQKEAYWAEQADIQRRSASAWLALLEGRKSDALAEMRAAAAMEDRTEKASVTPGPLAPARELVAEMLLQMNQPADALTEFEATLKKEPNRFRALFGAAKAASLAGDRQKARTYAAALAKVCERADKPERPELVEARRFTTSAR
jgi:PAS domain S-box-containing protein